MVVKCKKCSYLIKDNNSILKNFVTNLGRKDIIIGKELDDLVGEFLSKKKLNNESDLVSRGYKHIFNCVDFGTGSLM